MSPCNTCCHLLGKWKCCKSFSALAKWSPLLRPVSHFYIACTPFPATTTTRTTMLPALILMRSICCQTNQRQTNAFGWWLPLISISCWNDLIWFDFSFNSFSLCAPFLFISSLAGVCCCLCFHSLLALCRNISHWSFFIYFSQFWCRSYASLTHLQIHIRTHGHVYVRPASRSAVHKGLFLKIIRIYEYVYIL